MYSHSLMGYTQVVMSDTFLLVFIFVLAFFQSLTTADPLNGRYDDNLCLLLVNSCSLDCFTEKLLLIFFSHLTHSVYTQTVVMKEKQIETKTFFTEKFISLAFKYLKLFFFV